MLGNLILVINNMKKFRLYKGFNLIGEYNSILEAKSNAPNDDGFYNLIGENYKDSWHILKGVSYANI